MTGENAKPDWATATIGDILSVRNGVAFKSSDYCSDGIPLIRQTDLKGSTVDVASSKKLPSYFADACPGALIKGGDLLIGMSGSLGKVAKYQHAEPALQNQRTGLLRLKPNISASFAKLALTLVEPQIIAKGKGIAVQNVSAKDIEECCFSLPPEDERDDLAAYVEMQWSRLDASVAALKRVQANLKRYRASVLKAACEGRLVPTEAEIARNEGRSFESGNDLLSTAIKKREQEWNGRGAYIPPAGIQSGDLPALSEGWVWASAEQVCNPIASGSTPVPEAMYAGSGDVPFLKVYNLTFTGALDFTIKPTFVGSATHMGQLARSKVRPGDVLTNIVGPPLGKVSVVPDTYPEWNINQAIVVFRATEAIISSLLAYWLQSRAVVGRLERTAKATAGQFNLQVSTCRKLALPLPPLAEQHRIVAEVERRLSVIERLEATVTANLKRAERLRQSVLARAFSSPGAG